MSKDQKENKTVGFALFFDKETAQAFNVLANLAYESLEKLSLEEKVELKPEIELIVNGIIDPFNHKFHEFKWCKDPNCTYATENK